MRKAVAAGDLTKRATLLEPHVQRDADGHRVFFWEATRDADGRP